MAITKVLARHWKIEIDVGTAQGPAWVEIKGLSSFSWSAEKASADTTSFDEGGVRSHLPASRGMTLSLEGYYLEDPQTGERDPGQEAVEELARKVGPEGIGTFRITSPGGTVREFDASANVAGTGGGTDDPTSWSVELEISGAVREVTP